LADENIILDFKRLPKHFNSDLNKYQIKIPQQKKNIKLGYQTIWIEYFQNGIFKRKLPVSFEVSQIQNVVVALKKIDKGSVISTDDVNLKEKVITENPVEFYHSLKAVVGNESTRIIKEGSIINNSLIRKPPIVKNGERVNLHILLNNVLIKTFGIVKNDGGFGEQVKLVCEQTGKKFYGIVHSEDTVIVNL